MNNRTEFINRRRMLQVTLAGLSAGLTGAAPGNRTRMGLGIHSFGIHTRMDRTAGRDFTDPLSFLEYAHSLGAGGVQVEVGARDETYTRRLRERMESLGLYLESQTRLPNAPNEVEQFEMEMRASKEAGATVMRIAMGGRRYEDLTSRDQFNAYVKQCRRRLELAEPVARRHGMRLAVENHKDLLIAEFIQLLETISSEFVGVCVDTGNSIALLENPIDVVEAYAPWSMAAHLKDAVVCRYRDGFLLGDPVLGTGILDLPRICKILLEAKPDLRFSLELITRDALEIPCLMEEYWATFPDVPGAALAQALRWVEQHATPKEMPQVGNLTPEAHMQLEERNIVESIDYAARRLAL
jgi:3-oxoisoapionate decarboxylase